MSDILTRLQHDRAIRDAARCLLDADFDFVRGGVRDRSLMQRAADEVSDTSTTVADKALGFAREHQLAIGAGLAAALVLLFRNVLLDLILDLLGDEEPPAPPLKARVRNLMQSVAEPAKRASRWLRE